MDTWYVRDRRDEACKIPVTEPVGIDVLPQERDLLRSLFGDPAGLLNDPLRIAGPLPPTSVGNHTETAEVVTASHHGDPGVYPVGPVWYDIMIGLIFRKVDGEPLLVYPFFLRKG